jgi:hypothetical protein
MFALQTITGIKPMFGNKCMGFGHRFVSGYCSEGEHKVRPYICFEYRLDFGYCQRQAFFSNFTYVHKVRPNIHLLKKDTDI